MKAQWLSLWSDAKAWGRIHPVTVCLMAAVIILFGMGVCGGRL